MSRHVTVDQISVDDYRAYKRIAAAYKNGRLAARDIFSVGAQHISALIHDEGGELPESLRPTMDRISECADKHAQAAEAKAEAVEDAAMAAEDDRKAKADREAAAKAGDLTTRGTPDEVTG